MDMAQLDRELLGNLWVAPDVWNNLAYLCDACNGRFVGTDDARRAQVHLLACLQKYGLDHVAAEPFEMRGWDRGQSRLTILAEPSPFELPCLALPGSPGCDLETEIVDVNRGAPEDYQRLGPALVGKIAINTADGISRGEMYRGACQAGAGAFIFSGNQPGMLVPTGSVIGDVPAIGLAYEPKARLKRLLAAGPVRAHLASTSAVHPLTTANVVAEIPGADPAQGWIVVGGHYDGHDIGQAAHDNGAGTAAVLEAARLLAPLRGRLQAGLRFVLFSGEELGLWGSYAYAQQHAGEFDSIRLVVNVDVVAMAMPLVLQTQASPELANYLRALPLGQLDLALNDDPKAFIMNSDHFPFSLGGVSSVWAVTSGAPAGTGWVHFSADTLDKVDPRLLRQTAGALARLLLRMALEPQALPRGCKSPDDVKKAVRDAGFEGYLRWAGRWPF